MMRSTATALLRLQSRIIRTVIPRSRGTTPLPDVRTVRRILIVRLDEIGDMVLFTPFLRELRRAAPQAEITLVVNLATRNLFETCPYIDHLAALSTRVPPWLRPAVMPIRAARLSCTPHVRTPDLAIVPRWGVDSSYATYLAYFSGATVRVGPTEHINSQKEALNPGFDGLLTHAIPNSGMKHHVEHSMDILRYLGIAPASDTIELWTSADDEHRAARLLAEAGIDHEAPLVTFALSGGHSLLKQWSVSRMAELARSLRQHHGVSIAVVGGPGEQALVEEFIGVADIPVANAVGRTTLRETLALMKRSALFVGNDAGPLHMAAAVCPRVVGVFGSSDHERFGPWGAHCAVVFHDVPCAPVHQASRPDRCTRCIHGVPLCLTNLGVDTVLAACETALAGRR